MDYKFSNEVMTKTALEFLEKKPSLLAWEVLFEYLDHVKQAALEAETEEEFMSKLAAFNLMSISKSIAGAGEKVMPLVGEGVEKGTEAVKKVGKKVGGKISGFFAKKEVPKGLKAYQNGPPPKVAND
jgi:hypothetical protein